MAVSTWVPMSEDQARALVSLVEKESRRIAIAAMCNGVPAQDLAPALKAAGLAILRAFPRLSEQQIKENLSEAGKRYPTNIEAAFKLGLTVTYYVRQCTKLGVETAAERVRRERRA